MERAAFVTGASRGIGKAIAIELSKHFDVVIINCHTNSNALNNTQALIEENGARCLSFLGDVGDYHFVHSMIKSILHQPLSIELLVNNAGISHIGLLSDMTIEEWNTLVSTNLTSVFNCCKQIIPHMVNNRRGHIINISSMWGISGASCEVAYSATKGGINAFTKALAKELAPSNIQVNALACGAIDTDMNAEFSKEEIHALCNDIPACRLGQPEEIAKTVWQLYNTPLYLTGEIIKIDGGYL